MKHRLGYFLNQMIRSVDEMAGEEKGKKNGKLLTSHRSTIYPCYLPVLGEFNRSWSYKTCRCKYSEPLGNMNKS